MDFKSLISKLDSMEAPPKTPAAPELPKAVQLNEDAQLRVLAGTSSILEEAKKAKPDYIDIDKDGDKKEPMKKAAKEAKTKKESVDTDEEAVLEASEAQKKAREKFMSMVKGKKSEKKDDKKADAKKKEPAKKKDEKKTESKMMPKGKKRPVKESVQPKLSFKEMIQLVRESGGQQQIDPVDTVLFNWAKRVAAAKFTESAKQEVFAGLVYERMGGRFEMYDVLSENK